MKGPRKNIGDSQTRVRLQELSGI